MIIEIGKNLSELIALLIFAITVVCIYRLMISLNDKK